MIAPNIIVSKKRRSTDPASLELSIISPLQHFITFRRVPMMQTAASRQIMRFPIFIINLLWAPFDFNTTRIFQSLTDTPTPVAALMVLSISRRL
jgi:hypothetical protein